MDPSCDVRDWSLSQSGCARVSALAESRALQGTTRVISSAENKAIETAAPLADALQCNLEVREGMHENDRSANGFLPPEEFEVVADQFFVFSTRSVSGWETAFHVQERIVAEIEQCLSVPPSGDILFVGHGGVGTLLLCSLSGVPISRNHDQGDGGGGYYFQFSISTRTPHFGWTTMESLIDDIRGVV